MTAQPKSETELAEMIASAPGALSIRGGGTRQVGKPAQHAPLDVSGLCGITLYDPGALTLVVQAGTPLAQIESALDAENQRLAFEPMDHRGLLGTSGQPTIGGVVAANVSGPRRIQAGACRDFMLGVRFVDGAGNVVKNGGRVMKNVTGYDLVKLMAGSWGTLGVLSEVSFKVLPKPETAACVMIDNLTIPEAVQAMSRALGSPFEVSGAAHVPVGLDGHPVTMLRLEGFEGSVRYRTAQLAGMFAGEAIRIEPDPAQVAKGWAWLRDVEALQGQGGDVWRISAKPSDAPELIDRLKPQATLLDWGGGLIWAQLPESTDARARLGAFDGHATLIRGSTASRTALPVFHPEPAPIAALTQGLRQRFDPRGILNARLMSA